MNDKEFQEVVECGIDRLPDEFKNHLDNVEIVVADAPDEIQTIKMKLKYQTDRPFFLLGLYKGVPVGGRSVFSTPPLPARITLFKDSIEKYCRTREEMISQIHRTLLHEIGHHFGLSDKELRELGF